MYAERVWGCEGDSNATVGDRGCVVVVIAGHVAGTRGSVVVPSTADVLEGWVLDVCLCLGCDAVGGVCVEWVWSLEQGLEEWGGVMDV